VNTFGTIQRSGQSQDPSIWENLHIDWGKPVFFYQGFHVERQKAKHEAHMNEQKNGKLLQLPICFMPNPISLVFLIKPIRNCFTDGLVRTYSGTAGPWDGWVNGGRLSAEREVGRSKVPGAPLIVFFFTHDVAGYLTRA
jgi:hypothetical protein